ncbi:hypothetical protein [Bradyrhizobium sp. JYMT SZCCT0428]|uniref:hypothetical protein n=1 Tax=Bradyrhizobium sp. JYMT SZCCT0428 TaxID=2807673 RepID=UPI001BA4C120|nr:hypothetical protein [Bradyrhizobium sp. JYMT SZCCT0428]MBR1153719.1 hypothetical protein [Bradyrhizobium sp. JYMT SZCCT0428]
MTFTIHASKDEHIAQTLRLDPLVAVTKARSLLDVGWEVHITDTAGQRYPPDKFDDLLPSTHSFISAVCDHGPMLGCPLSSLVRYCVIF